VVFLIYLVMIFGWNGAPGEYIIFALAAQVLHGTFVPALPHWHDDVSFSSRWLMDDGFL
jgi:hypothetical protein